MTISKRLALLAFLPVVALAGIFPLAAGTQSKVVDGTVLPVRSLKIDAFKSGSQQRLFGKLEFVGGLVMATAGGEMGATSSIRILPDGQHFLSVMDTGYWAKGKLVRDADGALSGIADFSIAEMIGPSGVRSDRKGDVDAEGLTVTGDAIYVSFEERHRIDTYPLENYAAAGPIKSQKPLLPPHTRLKPNGGMETVLVAPQNTDLAGSLLFVAERSYNKAGDFIAGVQDGPKKGNFYVHRTPPYDVTDGAFLPDGSLLLLERRFGLQDGIGTRIRRFKSSDIQGKGETIDGETIFEADFSYQIDNMEGLDVFAGPDGSTHLILTSDDNHSLLERNLMLEFRLVE